MGGRKSPVDSYHSLISFGYLSKIAGRSTRASGPTLERSHIPWSLAAGRRRRPGNPLGATVAPGRAVRRATRSVRYSPGGQQVSETRVFGKVQQRHQMPWIRPNSSIPALHVEGRGTQTAGQLRPRQPGLLLEPLQALWEVVGEDIDYSAVVCALSWHDAPALPRRGRLKEGVQGLPQGIRSLTAV